MIRFEPGFLDEIKSKIPISEIIGRHVSWHKKSRPARGDYWACCPWHGEKSPSFHCEDKKGRYHCFGCGVSGDHFKVLTDLVGMSFPQAVAELAGLAGIELPGQRPLSPEQKRAYAIRMAELEKQKQVRIEIAAAEKQQKILSAGAIWHQSTAIWGTLAEYYLEWRCPGLCPKRETELRFHPKLEMDPENPRGDTNPALIARVSDPAGKGTAIWRIYFNMDGTPKLDRQGKKIKLGYGPSSGGAVRLGGLAKTIGLAEGVETSRAVVELGAPYPVWAGLSTSGVQSFIIPEGVEKVVLYTDPDGGKIGFKKKPDGTEYISKPAGPEAARKFIEANPGRIITVADGAFDADYLELLQNLRGVPIR